MITSSKIERLRDYDINYLKIALIRSELSYCNRKKVGCIIVNNNMIISDGFNGTPTGFDNVCECEDGLTKDVVIHAEANAIAKCARLGSSAQGSTMYITHSPCVPCAKQIITAGVKRVCFIEFYKDSKGIELLEEANIIVEKIEI